MKSERHLLENTKKDSDSHEIPKVLYDAVAGHHNAPSSHEEADVERRPGNLF